MFKKVLKFLNTFEVHAGAISLGIMIILLLLQVFSRYVVRRSISWTEEVALIFFVLSVYFGAAAAIRRNQHLRLELLLSKVGPKAKEVLLIVGNACFIFFNSVILTGLYAITKRLRTNDTRSAITDFPRWIIYAVILFLFALTIIRLLQDSYEKIKTIKRISVEQRTSQGIKEQT